MRPCALARLRNRVLHSACGLTLRSGRHYALLRECRTDQHLRLALQSKARRSSYACVRHCAQLLNLQSCAVHLQAQRAGQTKAGKTAQAINQHPCRTRSVLASTNVQPVCRSGSSAPMAKSTGCKCETACSRSALRPAFTMCPPMSLALIPLTTLLPALIHPQVQRKVAAAPPPHHIPAMAEAQPAQGHLHSPAVQQAVSVPLCRSPQ